MMFIRNWDELRKHMKDKKNEPLIFKIKNRQVEEQTKDTTKRPNPSASLPKDYNWEWLKEQAKKPRVGSPTIDGFLATITEYDKKKEKIDVNEFPYAIFHCVEDCCLLCQSLHKIDIDRRSWAQSLFLPPLHDLCLCSVVYSSHSFSPFIFPPSELVEQWYGDRFLERVFRGEYEPSGKRMKIGLERIRRAMEDGYLIWDEQRRDLVVPFLPPFEGVPKRLPPGLFPTADEVVLRSQQGWKWKNWEEWLTQRYKPPHEITHTATSAFSLKSLLQLLRGFIRGRNHR